MAFLLSKSIDAHFSNLDNDFFFKLCFSDTVMVGSFQTLMMGINVIIIRAFHVFCFSRMNDFIARKVYIKAQI